MTCAVVQSFCLFFYFFFFKARSSRKHLCDLSFDKCAQEMHPETTNGYSLMRNALRIYYVASRALDSSKSFTPM